MDEPKSAERVTYLIANHNLGAYIGECLESLRAQTNPNWLALIGDDASTDDSLEVIAAFRDLRCRLLINERNVGYIATLKRLISESSTDIVAILDADDAISPEATERLLNAYASDSRAEFVYSRFATYDSKLEVRQSVHGAPIRDRGTALVEPGVGAIRSFRKRAYSRTAGLDDAMLYAEDRDLVYKLEEVTRPVFVDAVLYHYRDRSTSQSRDPHKRETGAMNVLRARRVALRRRGIAGVERILYEMYFRADYLAYSRSTPPVVAGLARVVAAAAGAACRRLPASTIRSRA